MPISTAKRFRLGLGMAGLACAAAWVIYALEDANPLRVPSAFGSDRIVAVPAMLEYRNEESEPGNIEFHLRNDGTRPVKILSVNASCGCTIYEGTMPNTIEPGNNATLMFRVTPPSFGLKQSVVKIRTDSGDTPNVQVLLTLHGKKLTPPYVSRGPRDMRVQWVAGETPTRTKLQLTCVEPFDEPWLTAIEAHPALVAIEPPIVIDEHPLDEETVSREYEATLNFLSPQSGDTSQRISLIPITRTQSTKPHPDMSVTWEQVDALRAAPASLLFSFAADERDAEQQRRLVLVAADDVEWTITSITSDADWLRAEAVESESQNRQLNVVCAKPAGEREPHESATLRVATDHPRCPEVLVRVNRTFRDEPRAKNTAG